MFSAVFVCVPQSSAVFVVFRINIGTFGEQIRLKLRQMIEDWSAWQVLHVESPWELDPPVAAQIKTYKPDIPVLVLIGEYDTKGSHNSSEYLARIVPNVRRRYLKDAGHFSNMETQAEFNRVLTEFLESISVLREETKAKVSRIAEDVSGAKSP